MLENPELDEMICQQLSRHDLAQCVRVNKTWYAIVVPILWRDFTWLSDRTNQSSQSRFRRMVVEDYLREHQYSTLQEASHEQLTHEASPRILPKHGPFIRYLPGPNCLLGALGVAYDQHLFRQPATTQSSEPSPVELLSHLCKHSPSFQVPTATWTFGTLREDELLTIAKLMIHRIHVLELESRCGVTNRFLKRVLNHSSDTLEELHLGIDIVDRDGDSEGDGQDLDTPNAWTNLKVVILDRCKYKSDSRAFWSWLWKQCRQADTVAFMDKNIGGIISEHNLIPQRWESITGFKYDIAGTLPEGIRMHMSNLSKIYLNERFTSSRTTEEQLVGILSSCRQGWKEVTMWAVEDFKAAAGKALARHYQTLEVVVIDTRHGLSKEDLVFILASSPNLRKVHHVNAGRRRNNKTHTFSASLFIDEDPDTGLLKPWASELSLQSFNVKITDIPLPMAEGQGSAIQNRVYDRIARFTNLTSLCLSNIALSIGQGLERLSGLTSLEELKISQMRWTVGLKDAQWMTQHWPMLRILSVQCSKEAVEWLKEGYPEIALT
ncbi:hypothetical protein B0O80DRAFT_435340 [Mortierella sp. GBAus27b]|nr:hypothetical protein BGX31_007125 [Mortierella sp. GBA43]KAI8362231.1 hypothetical protein B0O80DRAFT_435340 [Mortierella sp. GBAus27b]